MKTTRKEKGITLIALVITIIVLLILAGVAISMLSGENGILQQAAKAKEDTEQKSTLEQVQLAATGAITNKKHSIDQTELEKELTNAFGAKGTGYTITGDEETGWTVEANGIKYTIAGDGKVEEYTEKKPGTDPEPTAGKWRYEEQSGETVVTDGVQVLKIGEEINYNCAQDENGEEVTASYTSYGTINGYGTDYTYNAKDYKEKWGILGVENGKILIMPMQNVPTSTNSTTMYLKGQAGYKNGVSELDKISEIYAHGKGADGARSIKVEDVDKVTGYNPNNTGVRDFDKTVTGTKYGSGIGQYGNEVTYEKKNDGIYYNETKSSYSTFTYLDGEDWKTLGDGERKKYTSSYYWYYPETLTTSNDTSKSVGIKHDSKAYTMLFGNTSSSTYYYWLGSSYVYTTAGCVYFGMRSVRDGLVCINNLYYSNGNAYNNSGGVRPAVSLKSDVQLTKEGDVWEIQ